MARKARVQTEGGSVSAAEGAQSTRERILAVSRQMFNEAGVQETAMFKIAAALSISPGNLTYYFKSKSDIVRALSDDLDQSVRAALENLSLPPRPDEVVAGLEAIFQTLWASKFFFNSALFVSRMERDLAARLQQVHATLIDVLADYLDKLIARRDMRRPHHPDGVRLLAGNTTAIWLQWLRFQSIETPGAQKAGKAAIRSCMRSHFCMMEPYLSRSFADEVWRQIETRYG